MALNEPGDLQPESDPVNSSNPALPAEGQEETAAVQNQVVGQYLDLVDKYGVGHPVVEQFVSGHSHNPALKEWVAIVKDLDASGSAASPPRRLPRFLWAVAATVIPLVLVTGAIYGTLSAVQNEVGMARTDLKNAKGEMATLRTERDEANTKAEQIKKEWDEDKIRQRNNPGETALETAASSQLRYRSYPLGTKLPAKLSLPDAVDIKGASYARAILADLNGDEERYRSELKKAGDDKENSWAVLAAAELKGPGELVNCLAKLEAKLEDDAGKDYSATSLLVLK